VAVEVEAPSYIWTPQEGPQTTFFNSIADEVLYGGAAGGGKSDALLGIAGSQISNPRYTALILRRTLASLYQKGGMIERSRQLYSGVGHFNQQRHSWTFPSGAGIQFGYCESDADVHQYQGSAYAVLGFEELTQFTSYQYEKICGYVRNPAGELRKMIRSTSNPGNVGHAWVKAKFVDPLKPYKLYRVKTTGLTRQYIPAKLTDNKILMENDPDYARRLNGLPEPWRTALRDGNWDIFMGQAFPEWNEKEHTCEPYELSPWYPKFICMDWGYAKPYCALGLSLDEQSRAIFYREHYGKEKLPSRVAEEIIRAYEGDNIRFVVLDKQCWSRTGNVKTIAEQLDDVFNKVGWSLEQSDSDRLGGKLIFHEFLRTRSSLPPAPTVEMDDKWMERIRNEGQEAIDEFEKTQQNEILPKIRIFRPGVINMKRYGCPNLIRTLPTLVLDEDNPDDVDTDGEDHPYDAARYGLKAIVGKAEKPLELRIEERLAKSGSDPTTRHIDRGWAKKILQQDDLTKGSLMRIMYRDRLAKRVSPKRRR
jgi:hypothetical protein